MGSLTSYCRAADLRRSRILWVWLSSQDTWTPFSSIEGEAIPYLAQGQIRRIAVIVPQLWSCNKNYSEPSPLQLAVGVRAEEAWAADHGEYNDAKSPSSLWVVLLYLLSANNPSTPLSLKCFLVCVFAFSSLNYNSSGQEKMWIFPQARIKPTRDPVLLVL